IISPSVAALLVDLDVPADERATLVDTEHTVRVGDFETVLALAGVRLVLNVGLETGSRAVGAARTLEMRLLLAADHNHGHRAIEMISVVVVQVIQMPALRILLRAETETAPAAHHVDWHLAAAGHHAGRRRRTGMAAGRLPGRMERAAIRGQVLDLVDDEPAVRVAAEAGDVLLVINRPAGHDAAVQLPHRHVDGEIRVAANCGQMEVVPKDVPA